jgi:hypothetical protein
VIIDNAMTDLCLVRVIVSPYRSNRVASTA